jgi:alanyl-tRNA synthetase
MRVVADHMRAMTFLIATASCLERMARIRAAQDHASRDAPRASGSAIADRFSTRWSTSWSASSATPYPELTTRADTVGAGDSQRGDALRAVLTDGLPRLEEALDRAARRLASAGDAAFRLYDTFGLPRDFIEDMVEAGKIAFDREGSNGPWRASGTRRARRAPSRRQARQSRWNVPARIRQTSFRGAPDVFRGYDANRADRHGHRPVP